MSDKEVPIQQWWPNYPNPIQMYLRWEHGDTYQLISNQSEIERIFRLTNVSTDNLRETKSLHTNENQPVTGPPPIYTDSTVYKEAGTTETTTNSEKPQENESQYLTVPSQTETSYRYISNEQDFQNTYTDQSMRPYKKRSFHSQLQNSENNMEAENSEDSEKQVSSSPPIEDAEKEKEKEGETKRRKRWKRKISRKQFRHHDIKLFTPGEYRTSTLLKQKDSSANIPKKPEVPPKESITELIVTTLGGQKQVSTQKKWQMEEAVDSTTKSDIEENNNTNAVQNNNVGKHNLPAIIMETPSVRRRSVDNTNISKTFKSMEHNFSRRMSVDMPMLNALSEQITENPTIQTQILESTQEKTNFKDNGTRQNVNGPTNVEKTNKNTVSNTENNRYRVEHISENEMHKFIVNSATNVEKTNKNTVSKTETSRYRVEHISEKEMHNFIANSSTNVEKTNNNTVSNTATNRYRIERISEKEMHNFIANSSTHVEKSNRNTISDNSHRYHIERIPENEVHHFIPKEQSLNSTPMEQSYVMKNVGYNGHLDNNLSIEKQSGQHLKPMEPSEDEQPAEPENLSLKRRHSGETPVDLSKKNYETVDQRQNHYHQKIYQNGEKKRLNVETEINKNKESSYSPSEYQQTGGNGPITSRRNDYIEEYVRNNISSHESTSPKVLHPTISYSKDSESHDKDRTIPHSIITDGVVKITNLNMWKEVLQRLLNESFSLQILDLIAHAYQKLERAKEESCIPPELKLKTQNMISEAYSYISVKLKQLNLDVSPAFVIKILGQSENTPEKDTLKQYIENIQRIRKLAINEPAVPKIPTSEFSHATNYLQTNRELVRSPPSSYSISLSQSNYQKSSNDRSGELSSKISEPSSALGHSKGSSSRVGDHHVSSSYTRGSSPRTSDNPISIGHPREIFQGNVDLSMSLEPPHRIRDYSISQGLPTGLPPRTNDHPALSGLPQRTLDHPIQRTNDHSIKFIDPVGSAPRTGPPGSMPQDHYGGPSQRSEDHHIQRSERSFLRPGEEFKQQCHSRKPSPKFSDHYMPLEHTREMSLRSDNHYMPTGYSGNPLARSNNHYMPLGYPRDLQFQLPDAYRNYMLNDLHPNPFLTQPGPNEPINRNSAPLGRPRSKSHRNIDNESGPPHHLKRSISNPQHVAMENPMLTHPYYEGAINKMPSPRVPTSTQNLYPPSSTQLPNLVQNKEVSITLPTVTPPKHQVPSSKVFYQNLHNHVVNGNPLSISVHPHLRSKKKASSTAPNVHRLEISEKKRGMPNVRDLHQKTPEQNHAPMKLSIPLVTSSVEEKITSSTDHLEILKVTDAPKEPAYEKVPLQDPVSPKPTETLKSIPVAVIVADKSMQITKETTPTSGEGQRKQTSPTIEIPEGTNVRLSVSSNSNENISSSEENLEQAFEKEQEENNSEFLVWLEKLKSNEKLKSKFLSQMGIIKKEEPIFLAGVSSSDPIEIVDSDEEDITEPQKDKEPTQKLADSSPKNISNQTSNSSQESGREQPKTRSNCTKISVSPETPKQTTMPAVAPNILKVQRVSPAPEVSDGITNSNTKESLSKKDYIPPIPLPYVPPTTSGQNISSSSATLECKKVIYSPEIEPISPVGNEPSFIFPEVRNGSKLLSPLSINPSKRGPDSVTSPTYQKRKNSLDFPVYRKEEGVNTKSNYPNDNDVKKRKSLDRPKVTKSPRIAPSGKLCYVRENHMFFRYFDDTQVKLFIRNLSIQDEELLRITGIEPEQLKSIHQPSNFGPDQLEKTEIIYLPRDVEFSEKEDIPEVEEFIKETGLVEQFVPKDFADFYRYVTGFQIIKNKHPVSLQTFLTMYNTNRTSELLRKYLERDELSSRQIKR